jgi:hypothetical protein
MRQQNEERQGASTYGAHEAKSKTQEAASGVVDKARNVASAVGEKARDAASSVASTAGHIAADVGDKAENATSAVGGGMKSLADTIREKSPQSGMLHSAASSVADGLENSGRYLQEHGLSGMGEDLTNLVRRNPLPAVLLGIGFGFLLARAITPRS